MERPTLLLRPTVGSISEQMQVTVHWQAQPAPQPHAFTITSSTIMGKQSHTSHVMRLP